MSFIWPTMLFSLLFIPLLVIAYFFMQRRRQKLAAGYSKLGFGEAPAAFSNRRRHIAPALFLLGFIILFVALARPQAEVQLPRIEGTVILGFDVSGSMLAEDIEPSRLEAAKAVALEFVERQPPTLQIGVVAFSNNGFAVQAPTNEREQILESISRLSPQQGTSLGQGIMAALNTIESGSGRFNMDEEAETTELPQPEGTSPSAVIVLLTDGENNEVPDPLEAAQIAADRDIRIYTIGIGSTEGTVVEVNGFSVHTRLDETTLQRIADISGGSYYHADSFEDLQGVYDSLTPQLVIRPEEMEVTSIFAGVSMLIMLIGGLLSLIWFKRLP
jgi:Ca-activated chloride channel homolog